MFLIANYFFNIVVLKEIYIVTFEIMGVFMTTSPNCKLSFSLTLNGIIRHIS